jgi:hypothetical protein
MAKNKSSATLTHRSAKSGRFVLGRTAFSKVSAVEGIVLSRDLHDDLHRLGSASPGKRRTVLADKYGKK